MYLRMVTDGNEAYHGHHSEMCKNIKSPCCATGTHSMVGQLCFKNKPTNRLTEEEVSSVVNRGSGESEEDCQKVQTSGPQINKHNDL